MMYCGQQWFSNLDLVLDMFEEDRGPYNISKHIQLKRDSGFKHEFFSLSSMFQDLI